MRCMPVDPTNPRHPSERTSAVEAVAELLTRVAAERRLDFEPPPPPVLDALPGLTHTVEDVAGRCRDGQERRWLAAALAALSHHVQVSTLPEPLPSPDPSDTSNLWGPPGCGGGGRDLAAQAPGLPTPRRETAMGVPRGLPRGG
jgi:hypothetical protein